MRRRSYKIRVKYKKRKYYPQIKIAGLWWYIKYYEDGLTLLDKKTYETSKTNAIEKAKNYLKKCSYQKIEKQRKRERYRREKKQCKGVITWSPDEEKDI